MNVKLSKASIAKLETIKPELKAVVLKACETMPFDITVLEGIRTVERQKQLVAQGASKTMNSKHLTGRAVDLAPWPVNWKDVGKFNEMSKHVLRAAEELKTPIVWGGSWKTFKDCPHFELEVK